MKINSPPLELTATTIDEVIVSLDRIIAWARASGSRLGYFPALYRKVTLDVRAGIGAGQFADGTRMARLDVIFANRYLAALATYLRGEETTSAWGRALRASHYWRPVVLQHLLLGMNAHIGLDLGLAAAATVPAAELPDLAGDFERINAILAGRVDEVQEELADVWPLLRLLDRVAREKDEALVHFAITIGRGHAWRIAKEVGALPAAARVARIEELDRRVAAVGRLIEKPSRTTQAILLAVRLGERRRVEDIIDILI